jgi:hypothetical protein
MPVRYELMCQKKVSNIPADEFALVFNSSTYYYGHEKPAGPRLAVRPAALRRDRPTFQRASTAYANWRPPMSLDLNVLAHEAVREIGT